MNFITPGRWVNSTTSAHRALPLLGGVTLPALVLRTRSSSGMAWDLATVAQLIAGVRTSRVLRKSRLVPAAASTTFRPRPELSSSATLDLFSEASADYLICMAATLAGSADTKNSASALLTISLSFELAKQQETANILASEAAKTQADAQRQAQINSLTAAIQALNALLKHELMTLDFAGALVIGLILIDLNNQLTQLLQ